MPQRSRTLLEGWLEEYAATVPNAAPARVATQDASDGRDGGLVVTPLRNATTSVYIQQRDPHGTWTVTIEEQPEITELTSGELIELADELVAVAHLCAFLERTAAAHETRAV